MQDPERQNEIAKEALKKFLVGEIEQSYRQDGSVQFIFKGRWEMRSFPNAVAYLYENTGKGKNIDPYVSADGTAWIIFSNILSQMNFKNNALDVLKLYIDSCYELQTKHNQRIHKGAPFFWISEHYYNLGQFNLAKQFMIYAFIEDTLSPLDPFAAPAYTKIKTQFPVPDNYLKELVSYVKANYTGSKIPFYAEEIIVSFDISKIKVVEKISRRD